MGGCDPSSDPKVSTVALSRKEVFNHFYHTWEDRFKDDPQWTDPKKRLSERQQSDLASADQLDPGSTKPGAMASGAQLPMGGWKVNFRNALAQSMNTAEALCICSSPPEKSGATGSVVYPLRLPASTDFPATKSWEDIRKKCG
eukprot:Skav213297  [mRNA]  locus=scaffold2480:528261:534739:- [translate_table: standard]